MSQILGVSKFRPVAACFDLPMVGTTLNVNFNCFKFECINFMFKFH